MAMEPAKSEENLDLHPEELKVINSASFPSQVSDKLFIRFHFIDLVAKGTTFKNCNFSHSIFTRAYFRNAKFIDCKFIGACFYDCNFRHAELHNCDFKYANFQHTLIPASEIIANLPEWPNVKRELLQSHRSNAQSLGDNDAAQIYIREEMAALREHYRRAREKKEAYYAAKYKGINKWLEVRWRSFTLWLGWITWGYGEYPLILLRFAVLSLIALGIIVTLQTSAFFQGMMLPQIGIAAWEGSKSTIFIFLGVPSAELLSVHWILSIIIVLLRYVLLGLFISVIFRRFSKR